MRIFLLRVLIGWWMVLFAWLFCWPIAWLVGGYDSANELAKDLSRGFWYGI